MKKNCNWHNVNMNRTIAINISMNALDYSLDKFHTFLLEIQYEISIPVQLNGIDYNVMFVMNFDNINILCTAQTVVWYEPNSRIDEWMTLRCAKRFRKDIVQWIEQHFIKIMMKHETLNRTKYSLWIKFDFFSLHFEYFLNSSKHQSLQFTIFHVALCHVCHSIKEFDSVKLIKMLVHIMNTFFSFIEFISAILFRLHFVPWLPYMMIIIIHNSHFALLYIQDFKHFINAMVTWYLFSW